MKPKLMIIGHGRHGKDTVAEYLQAMFNYTYKSSSLLCAQIFIYEVLRGKYDYESFEQCYVDRHNHRAEWHDLIWGYNKEEPTRLAKEIYKSCDIYVGLRRREEFIACRNEGVFDLSIWVDASKRLPPEDLSSNKLTADDADVVITNNYTQAELANKVARLGKLLFSRIEPIRIPGGTI